MEPEDTNIPNHIELLTLTIPATADFLGKFIAAAFEAEDREAPDLRMIQIELFAGADRSIDIYGPAGDTKFAHAVDQGITPLVCLDVQWKYRAEASENTNVVARVMYAL